MPSPTPIAFEDQANLDFIESSACLFLRILTLIRKCNGLINLRRRTFFRIWNISKPLASQSIFDLIQNRSIFFIYAQNNQL